MGRVRDLIISQSTMVPGVSGWMSFFLYSISQDVSPHKEYYVTVQLTSSNILKTRLHTGEVVQQCKQQLLSTPIYIDIVNPSYSDPRFPVPPNKSVITAIHRCKTARPKTGREELGSAYWTADPHRRKLQVANKK